MHCLPCTLFSTGNARNKVYNLWITTTPVNASLHVSVFLAILSENTLDIIGRHLNVYFFRVQ